MEIQGKIIAILPAVRGVSKTSGNPWCTQTYVLETIEQYSKRIPFEVFGEERISQFNIQMDEVLTISFDIVGREWNGKWFTKISCYGVSRPVQEQPQPQAQPQPQVQQQPTAQPQYVAPPYQPQQQPQSAGDSDLPF